MKYWGYFAFKLALVAGAIWAGWAALEAWMPEPDYFLRHRVSRFPQDLGWTGALMVLGLAGLGLIWLAVVDQKRRCKVCLSLLRMPVERGNWSRPLLLSPVETERICPFGHGSLAEPETHISTSQHPVWRASDSDIWKELEELESRDR